MPSPSRGQHEHSPSVPISKFAGGRGTSDANFGIKDTSDLVVLLLTSSSLDLELKD